MFQSDPLVSAFEISLIAFSEIFFCCYLGLSTFLPNLHILENMLFLFHWLVLNNINKDLLTICRHYFNIFQTIFWTINCFPSFPQNFYIHFNPHLLILLFGFLCLHHKYPIVYFISSPAFIDKLSIIYLDYSYLDEILIHFHFLFEIVPVSNQKYSTMSIFPVNGTIKAHWFYL